MAGEAVERTAEALLRGNGGRCVVLRMPAPASAGDVTGELGLAAPGFQDTEVGPAVFRKAGSVARMLVSAASVEALAGAAGMDAVRAMFAGCAGVVVDGLVFTVTGVEAVEAFGAVGFYAVGLRAPLG